MGKKRNMTVTDADSIVWAACAVLKEGDPVNFALSIVKRQMMKIQRKTKADIMITVIGGEGNFRDDIYPEYKANRTQPRPVYFHQARNYILEKWDAHLTSGMEADDYVGIVNEKMRDKCNVTMVHIDKDLNMLPGNHYNFRTEEFYTTTELEGYKLFGIQMLKGDSTDNIPGLFKLTGRKASVKYKARINDCVSSGDIDNEIVAIYTEDVKNGTQEYIDRMEAMHLNRELLWILRKPRGEHE